MAKPTSRATLVDYALRQLGAPVIKINVSNEQIDDLLDDAIQIYQEYNSEAVVDTYRKHQITADDVSNEYITVPESMLVVSRVLPFGMAGGSKFSTAWQVKYEALGDLHSTGYDLKNYDINMKHLALIEYLFSVEQNAEFARKQGRLYIDGIKWGTDLRVGDWLVLEGKQAIDPDEFPLIYNDIHLKKYFTALLKKQWGANMSKFDGIALPGGVTFDGQRKYDEAVTELNLIEETMRDEFETPLSYIYMG